MFCRESVLLRSPLPLIVCLLWDSIVNVDFEKIEDLDKFVFNLQRYKESYQGMKESVTMFAVKSEVWKGNDWP